MKQLIFRSFLSHVHCSLILLREDLYKNKFMSPHKLCSWRTSAACLRCFCNWRGRLWLDFVFVGNKFNHFYCKEVMKNDSPWDLETSSFILVIHHKAMKHITLIFNIQKYCWEGLTLPNCIKTYQTQERMTNHNSIQIILGNSPRNKLQENCTYIPERPCPKIP